MLASLLLLSQLVLISPAPDLGSGSWLLTWTAVTYEPGSCPYKPLPDQYTGKIGYISGCLVVHYQVAERKMERRFPTKKEAEKFIKNAPTAESVGWGDHCKDFKIKWKPVETKEEETKAP